MEIVLGAGLFDADLAERYGWINRALPADEVDSHVDDLARRIALLPAEVVASATAAIDAAADPTPKGMSEENSLVSSLMMMPDALEKVRAALKAGAQTPEGERDLEGLLNGI